MSKDQKWAERAAELTKFSEIIDQRMKDLASWRRVWAKELAERTRGGGR